MNAAFVWMCFWRGILPRCSYKPWLAIQEETQKSWCSAKYAKHRAIPCRSIHRWGYEKGSAFLPVDIACSVCACTHAPASISLGWLKLTKYSRMTLNSWFPYLHFLKAEFIVISHYSGFRSCWSSVRQTSIPPTEWHLWCSGEIQGPSSYTGFESKMGLKFTTAMSDWFCDIETIRKQSFCRTHRRGHFNWGYSG